MGVDVVRWTVSVGVMISILVANQPPAAAAGAETSDETRRKMIESMYEDYKRSFPEVEDLSAAEAMQLLEQGRAVFVDVRKSKEQRVSMLPGAITEKQFLKEPEAHGDRVIIGYCTISYRSGKLADKLRKRDIPMVNLRGGILAWLHAGGQVMRDGEPVKQVHVYGKRWDLAPAAFESVW
jgi:sodium/bile acid cotransporter 7